MLWLVPSNINTILIFTFSHTCVHLTHTYRERGRGRAIILILIETHGQSVEGLIYNKKRTHEHTRRLVAHH